MTPTPLAGIRVLAVDLDRTALDASGRLDDVTIAALSEASSQGLRVVFVSARPLWSMRELTTRVTTTEFAIAAGGAIVADGDDRELHRRAVPASIVAELLSAVQQHHASALLYRRDDTFTFGDSPAQRDEIALTSRLASPPVWPGGDADKVLLFVADGHPVLRAASRLDLRLSRSHGSLVEANAQGVDKGTALRWLAGACGWNLSQLAAIGDGDNDVPMFRVVGHAFCVANGSPSARAAADTIVRGHDDHGVAAVLGDWLAARRDSETSAGHRRDRAR